MKKVLLGSLVLLFSTLSLAEGGGAGNNSDDVQIADYKLICFELGTQGCESLIAEYEQRQTTLDRKMEILESLSQMIQ